MLMPKKKKTNEKKHTINLGEYPEYVSLGNKVDAAHELLEEEKKLLVEDYQKIKQLEKEEGIEEEAIKHFEKKLHSLIKIVVELEGYVQEIESGNAILKHNRSVEELGKQLSVSIEEVEQFSQSILEEESKILGLAKRIKNILIKAKRFQEIMKD